jgi:hypothetical protein
MQHYRSMKTKVEQKFCKRYIINNLKEHSKKSIYLLYTSQGNQTVLKFDQPLYNEYPNTSNNNIRKFNNS